MPWLYRWKPGVEVGERARYQERASVEAGFAEPALQVGDRSRGAERARRWAHEEASAQFVARADRPADQAAAGPEAAGRLAHGRRRTARPPRCCRQEALRR